MIGTHLFFVDVILLSLYAFLLVAVCYSLGAFIFNVQAAQPARKAFFNTVFGFLLIIDLYSCICTGFKTVNVFSLAVLAYIAKSNRQFFKTANLDLRSLLPFLYILPALFILYGIHTLQVSIEDDTKYYAKIAYSLQANGNENFYHFYNGYDAKFNGIVPYHYIELWTASFFNVTTGTLTLFSLKYFTYPFFISLFIFGFLATVQRRRLLFFVVILALTLFPLTRYLDIVDTGWPLMTDLWLRPNFIPYYLLLVLAYNAILDDNFKLFYLLLALSLTFSIVIVPSIILSLIALSAFLFFTRKQSLRESLVNVLPALLVLAGMLVMYKVFSSQINVTTDFSIKEMVLHNIKIWKAILVVSVVLITSGSVVLGSMFLYNRLVLKHAGLNRFLLFVFFLLLTGVFMFQALNQVDNSYQFAYFAYAGVGFAFMALVVKALDSVQATPLKITVGVIVVVLCLSVGVLADFNTKALSSKIMDTDLTNAQVLPEWKDEFSAYLAEHPHAKGGFVYSSQLTTFQPKGRHCLTKQLGSYVCCFTDDCNLPSITCRDSILYDMTEANKASYKKTIGWLNAFPDYTHNCDPVSYLKSGAFDYFICNIHLPVSDSAVAILPDTLANIKMVYLKSAVALK